MAIVDPFSTSPAPVASATIVDPFASPPAAPAPPFDPNAYLAGGAGPAARRRSGRMREAFTRPADTSNIPAPTMVELGERYKNIGVGAAQGVPAAILGLPGDVLSLAVDNPFTSQSIANAMFGPAATPDVTAGRMIGGIATGFAAPAAAGRIAQIKNAMAPSYPLAAKGLGAAEYALDPISGAVTAAANKAARVTRGAAPATPTTDALLNSARADYAVMDNSNLAVSPDVLKSAVSDIKKTLETSRYVEELDVSARNFLNILEERAKSPQSLTQLDALRGRARDLAYEASGGEQKVLSAISRKLDETIDSIDSAKVVARDPSLPSANPDEVREAFLSARDKFSRAAKSKEVETLIHKAEQSTQDNPVKALRTQFSALAKNEDRLAQYTAAEQKVIKDIAAGNIGSGTLQRLESLMPGFSRSSMFGNLMAALAGTAGSSIAGPFGALAFGIPGTIGKAAETARGAQAVPFANRFAENVRAGNLGEIMAPTFNPATVRNWMRPGAGLYGAFNQDVNQ